MISRSIAAVLFALLTACGSVLVGYLVPAIRALLAPAIAAAEEGGR